MTPEKDISRQFEAGMGGDCSICRRRNYCSKGCKENQRRQERLIKEAFTKTWAGDMLLTMNAELRGSY